MKADRIKVHVTLTREIRAALSDVIEQRGTTLSAEVNARLEQSLADEFDECFEQLRKTRLRAGFCGLPHANKD